MYRSPQNDLKTPKCEKNVYYKEIVSTNIHSCCFILSAKVLKPKVWFYLILGLGYLQTESCPLPHALGSTSFSSHIGLKKYPQPPLLAILSMPSCLQCHGTKLMSSGDREWGWRSEDKQKLLYHTLHGLSLKNKRKLPVMQGASSEAVRQPWSWIQRELDKEGWIKFEQLVQLKQIGIHRLDISQ